MKKSVLAVLLAVCIVTPIFAATNTKKEINKQTKQPAKTEIKNDTKTEKSKYRKGAMELVIKDGVSVYREVNMKDFNESGDEHFKVNTSFSIGADFFYYLFPKLAVGLGVDHNIETKIDSFSFGSFNMCKPIVGYTNIYAQVKPIIDLESKFLDNIYFLGQIGYGIASMDYSFNLGFSRVKMELENGMYWGIGVGTTIKQNFIVELLYSCNYNKAKVNVGNMSEEKTTKGDTVHQIVKLNFGYKFNF